MEGIPRFRGIGRANIREVIENALRRRRPIVEKEHNPSVENGGTLQGHNDRSLVIGIVVDKVPNGFKNLGCLLVVEDVVSAPDLAGQYASSLIMFQYILCDLEGEFQVYTR